MSRRIKDKNGFLEVKDNPLSKVGVFPYLGSEIGAPDPDRIYYVYRPAEELSRPETIESFKLLPMVDDHEWLGESGTPAEKKGVHGTIGEQVYFDDTYLRGNIKITSDTLQKKLDNGKVQLSPAYNFRCDFEEGVFNGERYDAIQRNIRANHLALVKEGRTGADVRVLDHNTITIDQQTTESKTMTIEELLAAIAALSDEDKAKLLTALTPVADEKQEKTEDEPPKVDEDAAEEAAETAEEAAEAVVEAAESAAEAAESGDIEAVIEAEAAIEVAEVKIEQVKEDLEQAVMDSLKRRVKLAARNVKALDDNARLKARLAKIERESKAMDEGAIIKRIAGRDALAKRLERHVGVFDHASMTTEQVAQYGIKKLGIKCPKGHEAIAMDAWLQGRVSDAEKRAQDSQVKPKNLWGDE